MSTGEDVQRAIEALARVASMRRDPRDTQFAGFATLLIDHLPWEDLLIEGEEEGWQERWEKVAAQGLYDFACHVATHTLRSAHGDMSKIPDLTELDDEGGKGMSREVKYQAWYRHEKRMYEVLALHLGEFGSVEVFDGWITGFAPGEKAKVTRCFTLNGVELREFTGLKDKNGKDIYEGDIVRATLSDDIGQRVKEVTEEVCYNEGLLCPFYMRVNYEEDWWKDSLVGGFEVIGNIYEHPHLVEGKL